MGEQADRFEAVRAAELSLLGPDVRGDGARLRSILHPDFVEIGRSGRRWTRDEIIDALVQEEGCVAPDAPVALLTWMLDKIHEWTHAPEVFADPHYRDRHLADVLIYWFTRTSTSAANNVYAEYGSLFADPDAFANSGVPTAVIAFAEDISIRRYSEYANTIARWTDADGGGHFAALEQPEALLADLRAFAREVVG